MKTRYTIGALMALAGLGCSAAAQDSVSRNGDGGNGLPGDAVSPYIAGANEQCNTYVVDLRGFRSSWGTPFGIAPIVKTSKTEPGVFFNNLWSAQALSRTSINVTRTPFATYSEWFGPGFGVNDDATLNLPGSPVSVDGTTRQLGAAVSDFGGDFTVNERYNGILGAMINYVPVSDGSQTRLYVGRVVAATNGLSITEDRAQFGLGAVDANGNIHFRGDDFQLSGPNPLVEDNYFRVRMVDPDGAGAKVGRDCTKTNVIDNSADVVLAYNDVPATDWVLKRSVTAHNAPQIVPQDMAGRPIMQGTNFLKEYVYEKVPFPAALATDVAGHLMGADDHRGNLGHSRYNYFPGSTNGTNVLIGRNAASQNKHLLTWGLNATADVTGFHRFDLPLSVIDNCDGFDTASSGASALDEFFGHQSQTAFRGGSGQAAVICDRNSNLLAAGTVAIGGASSATNPLNYVAVAKRTPGGAVSWTVAGWNFGSVGKEITNGFGVPIGQMVRLGLVTGGTPTGPSMSPPCFDSVGNVWFFTAAELYNRIDTDGDGVPDTSDFDTVLVRCVYDEASFSFCPELVLEVGDTFRGKNSDTRYQIRFLGIADSNSVSTGTLFSGNINQDTYADNPRAALATRDGRTLGGLVLGAELVYDVNGDGEFVKVTGTTGDPLSEDQEYNALMFIGGAYCRADWNLDGAFDAFDYDDFVSDYFNFVNGFGGFPDYNADGYVDAFDYDDFVSDFFNGC